MSMITLRFFTSQVPSTFLVSVLLLIWFSSPLFAEDALKAPSSPPTRTVIAEVLEVEGDFHIVRGERGEIRIEVTPDTKVSEKFIFGDRIKAILLPNDVALSITRATPDEPIGITVHESDEPPPSTPTATEKSKHSEEGPKESPDETSPLYKAYQVPKVRVIIEDILMVDGSFLIVRSEQGEIQIEITPDTKISEDFKFGDRIKARVTSADKALSVVRAGKDELKGIYGEVDPPTSSSTNESSVPSPPTTTANPLEEKKSEPLVEPTPSIRTIVADVLMVDGDFYIVRGERGEIQIEVTPETIISEAFDYGDRIKAEVHPNDKAITIKRASPDDPIGITPN